MAAFLPLSIYIQSATLNGLPYRKIVSTHRDLMAGGELVSKWPDNQIGNGVAAQRMFPRLADRELQDCSLPGDQGRRQDFRDRLEVALRTHTTEI